MHIWLLTPTDDRDHAFNGYDKCDLMVVRAKSALVARGLASDSAVDEGPDVWLDFRRSKCRRLGEVTPGAKRTEEVIAREVAWG